MRTKWSALVVAFMGAAICGDSVAQEKKQVPEAKAPVATKAYDKEKPKTGLAAASGTDQVVLVTTRGSFGLSFKTGEGGGAVFELANLGFDDKVAYLGSDANNYLHYQVVGWNVEM